MPFGAPEAEGFHPVGWQKDYFPDFLALIFFGLQSLLFLLAVAWQSVQRNLPGIFQFDGLFSRQLITKPSYPAAASWQAA